MNRCSTCWIVFFDEILALGTTDKFMLCVVGKLLKSIYNFMDKAQGNKCPLGQVEPLFNLADCFFDEILAFGTTDMFMLCVVGNLLKSIYNFMGQSAGEQVSLWGKLNRRSTWRIVLMWLVCFKSRMIENLFARAGVFF